MVRRLIAAVLRCHARIEPVHSLMAHTVVTVAKAQAAAAIAGLDPDTVVVVSLLRPSDEEASDDEAGPAGAAGATYRTETIRVDLGRPRVVPFALDAQSEF